MLVTGPVSVEFPQNVPKISPSGSPENYETILELDKSSIGLCGRVGKVFVYCTEGYDYTQTQDISTASGLNNITCFF